MSPVGLNPKSYGAGSGAVWGFLDKLQDRDLEVFSALVVGCIVVIPNWFGGIILVWFDQHIGYPKFCM